MLIFCCYKSHRVVTVPLNVVIFCQQDYTDLEEKHQRLLKLCNDQEKALEEVGVRLRDTKLEADNLK